MKTSDIVPGVTLKIPAGYYQQRPWCLKITKVVSVSQHTGAIDLLGHVLGMNGTTARKRPLVRRITIMPDRVEQFITPLKPGDPIPPEENGGMAGFVAGECGCWPRTQNRKTETMTAEQVQHPGPRRLRGIPGETYEERFPRYAYNAGVTAAYSGGYAARQRNAAQLHARAARFADSNDDTGAAELYSEMSAAALDAAEALEDLADLARQVREHYTARNGQAVPAGHPLITDPPRLLEDTEQARWAAARTRENEQEAGTP
jgi:hypothetical protein